MAFEITYKRLFEVRLLHEYFLLAKDNQPFFGLSDAERSDRVETQSREGKYDVQKHWEFFKVGETTREFKAHHLRMIPTALGFFVAIEVKKETQSDGSLLYRPIKELPSDLRLKIGANQLNPYFDNFTNTRIHRRLKAAYYFSNQQNIDPPQFKVAPALSEPIREWNPTQTYQMGEMSIQGGVVHESVEDGGAWQEISGTGYVNSGDELVVNGRFVYTFFASDNVTEAEFVLLDQADNVIKTISSSQTSGLGRVVLDFRTYRPAAAVLEDPPRFTPSDWYQLEVSINGAGTPEFSYQIFLDNDHAPHFATWDMVVDAGDTDFDLLDSNGHLITRKNAAGELQSHPIFEVRFKSRSTYWRYISQKPFDTSSIPDMNLFLESYPTPGLPNPKQLITKQPKILAQAYRKMHYQDGAVSKEVVIPLPEMSPVRHLDTKVYSDVYISAINRLLPQA